MKTIAYVQYGTKIEYHLELSLSVLSAMRFLNAKPADIRIALVTDQANRRDDLPIEHVFFSKGEFDQWMGTAGYNHRVKECALLKALNHFQDTVCLIDQDTIFRKHPAELFERISRTSCLMHADEGPIGTNPLWKPIMRSGVTQVAGYDVKPQSHMYNSGVVGVEYANRDWLKDVMAMEDGLYAISPIFNVEQLALSAVFEKHASVRLCDDVLWHYWGSPRPFIHVQIAQAFPQFTREVFERWLHAKELPHFGLPTKSLVDVLVSRLHGLRRRGGTDYQWAYLAYLSALRCAAKGDVYANAWARIAVDSLLQHRLNLYDDRQMTTETMEHDFSRFSHKNLDQVPWLTTELKDAWRKFWMDEEKTMGRVAASSARAQA